MDPRRFTYRNSRSGSVLAALTIVIGVETLAIHLWISQRHPVVGWSLVALSLVSLGWVFADYRARGRRAVILDGQSLELRIGLRAPLVLPRDRVARAIAPTWRELPEANAPYVNLTGPAQPNVLLTLAAPAAVPLVLGITRKVTQLGLHLDEPAAFLDALGGGGATLGAGD